MTALNASPVTIVARDSLGAAISQKETKRTKVCGVGFAFLLADFLGSCVMTELRAQVIVVPNSLSSAVSFGLDHERPDFPCGLHSKHQLHELQL